MCLVFSHRTTCLSDLVGLRSAETTDMRASRVYSDSYNVRVALPPSLPSTPSAVEQCRLRCTSTGPGQGLSGDEGVISSLYLIFVLLISV